MNETSGYIGNIETDPRNVKPKEREPLPVRPESSGSVFTIADIKEWLDGWRLFTGSGKEHTSGNQAINYALTFLEDEEDGIEAFVGQMKGLQNEE